MCDLLIAGAGHLGLLVARQWRAAHPEARVTLKFRSNNQGRSQSLVNAGFSVISQEGGESCSAPLVVFCAPPTGNPDYAGDIKSCIDQHWGKGEGAAFVFTSAGSVYSENNGGEVDENSETVKTERSGKLLDGEEHVLGSGGCVVRLGGLYTMDGGAHNYWLKGGEFPAKPRGLINLVHYEDGARAVVKCLENPGKVGGEVFLVSDGVPMSRQEIVDAASECNMLCGEANAVTFTGGDEVDGKKYNSGKIRNMLGWEPTYKSFGDFMKSG
eukprot:TRINITY_DN9220_c0_g1_i1.p1 TRINITY_DN9220_c0_g1~~TRINITY_DN9220_c0_g1_i1.p1  ORF type:complete len:270 (-),score=82.18 TRINITY_DN9220_c0_g1_i1:118-927(-)